MKAEKVNLKEAQISLYRTESPGDNPILFIHGAGGSKELWRAQMRRLDSKFPAIAIDLPGHYESTGEAYDSIDDYMRFIADFLDFMGIRKAILGGHSMGGAIAQKFALTHPERTKALVLIATGARLRVAPIVFELLESDFDAFQKLYREWGFGPNANARTIKATLELVKTIPPKFIARDFQACEKFDIMDKVSEIKAPALVAGATLDRLTPLKYSQYLAEKIQGARLEVIENSGHMIPLEKPILLAKLIEDFIHSVR